jgi:isoleucyl-tRNA synthetase
MDKYSADALRFLLLNSPLLNGEDYSLQDKHVADVYRKLNMVWNMYDFFTLYADVDGWIWNGDFSDPSESLNNSLDKWIVSRVHKLGADIDEYMQKYDIPDAMAGILPFIDDASNWYVRRSRKRFWKSEDDKDKNDAYKTLHYVLVYLSYLLAPFTPFLAEELYRKLTGKESVHLEHWPTKGAINELTIKQMRFTRDLITEGLSVRADKGIKVRQPLSKASLKLPVSLSSNELEEYKNIIAEELNVKNVVLEQGNKASLVFDINLTPKLVREGIARDIVRAVQNSRKKANLFVDNRIDLALISDNKQINESIKEFENQIKQETLAVSLNNRIDNFVFEEEISLNGQKLKVSFRVKK